MCLLSKVFFEAKCVSANLLFRPCPFLHTFWGSELEILTSLKLSILSIISNLPSQVNSNENTIILKSMDDSFFTGMPYAYVIVHDVFNCQFQYLSSSYSKKHGNHENVWITVIQTFSWLSCLFEYKDARYWNWQVKISYHSTFSCKLYNFTGPWGTSRTWKIDDMETKPSSTWKKGSLLIFYMM